MKPSRKKKKKTSLQSRNPVPGLELSTSGPIFEDYADNGSDHVQLQLSFEASHEAPTDSSGRPASIFCEEEEDEPQRAQVQQDVLTESPAAAIVPVQGSLVGSDASLTDEMAVSPEVGAVLDWEVRSDEETTISTPSSGTFHDHARDALQSIRELRASVEQDFRDFEGFENNDFEGFESVRPDANSRDVAQQTPVISSEVLTRMQTRSQGAALDLPNVMLKPLEHEKRNLDS